VVVRSIGSDLRMDYTVVGQSTNVAERTEQMALPGSILISADWRWPKERAGTHVARGRCRLLLQRPAWHRCVWRASTRRSRRSCNSSVTTCSRDAI
jgi:class 3 adenylate cyclase